MKGFKRGGQLRMMMMLRIKMPVLWILVGPSLACTLAIAGFIVVYFNDNENFNDNRNFSDKTNRWLPWSSGSKIDASKPDCYSPLKVYMYELPRKYNMGLLAYERPWEYDVGLLAMDDKSQEDPRAHHVPPILKLNDNAHKQYSVEYWLMVYLLNSWDRNDRKMAAIRVMDPETADIFFVPFFSSLSFKISGVNLGHPAAQVYKQLQEGVVEILSKSKWWQASQGRDHLLVVHHPNALRHYKDMLNQSIFVVADFGRSDETISRLNKDVVAPYVHVLPTYTQDDSTDPFSARKTVLFFQGRVQRKDGGIIRAKLGELLKNETDVRYDDSFVLEDALATATEGMRTSRFCLHPAGDTPSSCRLFDAIVNHCVPVIISDRIELPFEDTLNYTEFSLFFSSEEANVPDLLLSTLRDFSRERWLSMWNKLKAVSHHFEYQHPAKEDDAVNMIFKQVQLKVPEVKLAIHRAKRLKNCGLVEKAKINEDY